jgi:hypothetical protein
MQGAFAFPPNYGPKLPTCKTCAYPYLFFFERKKQEGGWGLSVAKKEKGEKGPKKKKEGRKAVNNQEKKMGNGRWKRKEIRK